MTRPEIDVSKAPRLTREPRTGPALASVRRASVRDPGGSTSSMDLRSSPLKSIVWVGLTSRFPHSGGYNVPLETNPFNSWATVIDCGDIPVTS